MLGRANTRFEVFQIRFLSQLWQVARLRRQDVVDYLQAWERPDTSVIGVSGAFSRTSAQSHPGVRRMVHSHKAQGTLAGVGAAQHCRPWRPGCRRVAALTVPQQLQVCHVRRGRGPGSFALSSSSTCSATGRHLSHHPCLAPRPWPRATVHSACLVPIERVWQNGDAGERALNPDLGRKSLRAAGAVQTVHAQLDNCSRFAGVAGSNGNVPESRNRVCRVHPVADGGLHARGRLRLGAAQATLTRWR